MHFYNGFFFIVMIICQNEAKVTLIKGVNQTVTFDGEELEIRVENSRATGGLTICFGSTSDASIDLCPKGYAGIQTNFAPNTHKIVLKVDRKGRVIEDSYLPRVDGIIKFNDDGSLNILVHKMSDATSVTLPHAKKWVPKEPTKSEKKEKPKSIATTNIIIIIVCIGLLAVFLLAIGSAIFFFWRKKKSTPPVPKASPPKHQVDVIDETLDTPQTTPAPTEDKQQIDDPMFPQSPMSPVTESRPKDNNDKAQAFRATVPPSPKVDPLEVGSKAVSKVTRSPLTPETKPSAITAKATPEASKTATKVPASPTTATPPGPSAKATPPESPTKATPPESPVKKAASSTQKTEASLPLDKTQPSNTRRSPPTTDFGTDTVAENLAEHSEYNVRGYVRRSEAHITGSPRKRSRLRPLVVDEVVETRFEVEHHLVYAERMKILRDHDHYMIMEHVSSQVNHKVSDAERALLKAAPADAPRLADAVVAEADEVIGRFVKGRPLTWDDDDELWDIVNEEATPASLGYVIMYRRVPSIFKPKEASMADPMVRTMPLMGLYILLLDKQYPTSFRVKLARELRTRASRIFPRMQKDQLKYAAFPATYMILAYNKNPAQFIAGDEIHSQASKKKQG